LSSLLSILLEYYTFFLGGGTAGIDQKYNYPMCNKNFLKKVFTSDNRENT
jgi:hypothetical protein